jgi:hypothetical protein
MGMTTNCCKRERESIHKLLMNPCASDASRSCESTSEISYHHYRPAGIVPEPCILVEVEVSAKGRRRVKSFVQR